MSGIDLWLAALDNTITAWEPDDAVAHFAEILRRNISEIAPEVPPAPEPTTAEQETTALNAAWEALKDLDVSAQSRAMAWLRDRLEAARQRQKDNRDPWAYSDEPPF
jgi:hypothetical protein